MYRHLKVSSTDSLTELEVQRSARADRSGLTYDHVKPEEVFGPRSNSRLASEIRSQNGVKYKALKQSYMENEGLIKKVLPDV